MTAAHWMRPASFVAFNLAMVLLVYFGIILPVMGYFGEANQRIDQLRSNLMRYNAIIAGEPQVKAYAAQVKEGNSRGELLAAQSEGIANANLQAKLKTLAEAANATVHSVQTLPPRTVRGETLVGARIEIQGGIDAIDNALQSIESGLPLLLVASATMRPSMSMHFMQGAAEELNVDAQFDVYAGASQKDKS
jgi:hypothetical protein